MINIKFVEESDISEFESGRYNDPCNLDGSWTDLIESEFLDAYRILFERVGTVVSVVESGDSDGPLDADVAMSMWVDPTRVMPIVVRKASIRLRPLPNVIFDYLEQFINYAVLLDDYPIRMVFLPGSNVLALRDTPSDYLKLLGLDV